MSKAFSCSTMSLDGFIADPHDGGFHHLFRWYNNGDVDVPTQNGMKINTSAASAAHIGEMLARTGAMVVGRRLFDITNGWLGNHPYGGPVIVVTHHPPKDWEFANDDFTFVTGMEEALATAR